MFKLIGGVVVFGFALYGLVKYLERPVVIGSPEAGEGIGRSGGD